VVATPKVVAPEPAWIPPARPVYPRKKKAALTPREALRAKVQARALAQATKTASREAEAASSARSAGGPVEAGESEGAETPLALAAEGAAESPAEGARPRGPKARAAGKVRRAAPPPPAKEEEEEAAPPPKKLGFFARLLAAFRKPKASAPDE
jgi:hypothetical protein